MTQQISGSYPKGFQSILLALTLMIVPLVLGQGERVPQPFVSSGGDVVALYNGEVAVCSRESSLDQGSEQEYETEHSSLQYCYDEAPASDWIRRV